MAPPEIRSCYVNERSMPWFGGPGGPGGPGCDGEAANGSGFSRL